MPQASGALYGLLLSGLEGLVVCMERARGQPPLDCQDLGLLANFVACNGAVRWAAWGRGLRGGRGGGGM